MKTFLFLGNGKPFACFLCLMAFFTLPTTAQISQGGIPLSFYTAELTGQTVPVEKMNFQDQRRLEQKANSEDEQGLPPRFGEPLPVDLNLNNSGVWHTLNNGDRIWRLTITSNEAHSLNLLYDDFYMPKGAHLFIYGKDGKQIIGALTDLNNKRDRVFATGLIYGEELTLEYFEPKKELGNGAISIANVVHGFRYINLSEIEGNLAKAYGSSGSCNVNVNCSEGADWQNEKKSVAVILVNGFRFCTGYLLNNTAQDCKPLFMTANHCSSPYDAVTNPNASNWTFMWNYESPGCSNTDGPTNQTTVGATMLANPGNTGNVERSDFALFELTESPKDAGYDVYFAGFDATAIPSSAIGIHHPAGDIKKISKENAPLTTTNYTSNSTAGNTHVRVADWDSGTTEGGSSGSPIFDEATKRTVGCLSGGGAACGNNASDWYGSTAHSWTNQNASDSRRRINGFLDPVGGGATTFVDGSADPCGNTPDPTCTDGIQNGDETGIDCGGSICEPCSTGCTDTEVTITINFDNYPEETSWSLTNDAGTTVASGGTYPNSPDGSTFTENVCLPDGCYTFTINDSYGDGICCGYGNGSYSVTAGSTSYASGGQFTSSDATDFCIGQAPPACTDVTVSITLDNYPEETSWTLNTDAGTSIGSGGTYNSQPDGSTVTADFCLDAGCYVFTINDTYGDGICCRYGRGSYTVSDGTTTFASGGQFTSTQATTFCVGGATANGAKTISTTVPNSLSVHPNPAKDVLNYTYQLKSNDQTTVIIRDVTGKTVLQTLQSGDTGFQNNSINISELSAGVYFITVATDAVNFTNKFVITK